jgi:putative ABC transport system substrate-binding protein
MSAYDPKRTLAVALHMSAFDPKRTSLVRPDTMLSSAPAAAMRRREFIKLVGGAAVAWPLPSNAQLPLPVIGFLNSRSPGEAASDLAGFRQGLAEAGYVENQNVTIEYRWAENRYERLPEQAAELVSRRVAVIAATGGPVTGLAVKAATTTIPFVFISGQDPVKLGFVASFAKPGGNATGVNMFITAVEAKRLGLLHELAPAAFRIAVIVNPNSPELDTQLSDMQTAVRAIGKELNVLRASNEREIDSAFAAFAQAGAEALLVAGDPVFNSLRERIVGLATRIRVPAIYEARSYVVAGGLASYGPNLVEMYRQVGSYTGQILKGVKPADLPVIQPTALELVINLKTAKALGLTVPPSLLARADEVID